jgi:hypothetical protein
MAQISLRPHFNSTRSFSVKPYLASATADERMAASGAAARTAGEAGRTSGGAGEAARTVGGDESRLAAPR